MDVSHLKNTGSSICCEQCGRDWPRRSRQLADPFEALAAKESIAAFHHCRPARPFRAITRVWHTPTGAAALEAYWNEGMSKALPVQ